MAVFLGTPAAAVPSLAAVADIDDVELVITRPDRPLGRSGRPAPPPVKVAALAWGLPVAQPESAAELARTLEAASPEFAVVVAYGRILKPAALAASRLGFVNVHFSLLPRWRGAAPVEHAILAGDERTGVSLMLIDEGLDTGPLLAGMETPIADDETGGSLTARLSYLAAKLLDDMLPDYLEGRLQSVPQLSGGVRQAPPFTKAEAQLDASWEAAHILRAVRAFRPRPGAWIDLDGEPVKIWAVQASDATADSGSVTVVNGAPVFGTSSGSVELVTVQPPGKRPVDGGSWINGRRGVGGSVRSVQ